MEHEKNMRVQKIRNGTVIDHIPGGQVFNVCDILNVPGIATSPVSLLCNAPSKRTGTKDILKIEERTLRDDELNRIALIAPNATINIIEDYESIDKRNVTLPDTLKGMFPCENLSCITNVESPREPVESTFMVLSQEPLSIKCVYCQRVQSDPRGALFQWCRVEPR